MNLQIRDATDTDVDALVALSRATIDACYRSFLGDAVDAYLASGAVEEYVDESVGRCTVILGDGQIAGYFVCKDDLIDLMMVRPELQRRGLGSRLLDHAEASLFHSYSELTLESFAPNEPANRFYRKHGWSEARSYFDQASGVTKLVFKKARKASETRQ